MRGSGSINIVCKNFQKTIERKKTNEKESGGENKEKGSQIICINKYTHLLISITILRGTG
jgi:hypothetical protein